MTKGFTLIELMVVLAIISVVAAISIPMYSDYTKRTKVTEAWEELTHITALQEQIFNDYRNYDTTTAGTRLQAYGANFAGKYFIITNAATNVWTATAYVCFNGASGCTSSSFDLAFTIDKDGNKTTTKGVAAVPLPGWNY